MRFNNSYVHVISGIKASSREEQKREKRHDANADPIEEERVPLSSRVKLVHVEKRTAARG